MTVATEDPVNQGLTSVDTHSAQDLDRISKLPKEIGVLLVIVGIGGILLPGPVGTPFLLLGGLVLWPGVFGRIDSAFHSRFPKIHGEGMRQMRRYVLDLEKGTLPSHPKKEKPLRILLVNRRKSIIITAALDSTTNSNESLKIQRLFYLHADFHGLVFLFF